MRAFLLAGPPEGATDDLARPIAGAPLFVRQLEWLRQSGVREVVINRVSDSPLPPSLGPQPLAATGVAVTWIPSSEPLSFSALARRVRPSGDVVLVLPHAVLGDLVFSPFLEQARQDKGDVLLVRNDVRVQLRHLPSNGTAARIELTEGWLLEVASEAVAHTLVESLLSGECRGVDVRGTSLAPGIWRARGALVVEGATVIAPCFLGLHTLVAEGATVGPGAVLDAGAVVEPNAVVCHARVAENVVVGQGIRLERACALPGRIVRHSGRVTAIDDPLLLGMRGPSGFPVRLAAAAALVAAAPVSALGSATAQSLVMRLARILARRGSWVGVRDDADPDAVVFDVMALLIPPEALDEERTAAKAYYAAKKSPRLDAKLLAGWFLGAVRTVRS
ncbi:MAG: hypothetical protein WCI05_14775 [Myxococcales bacterium]